MFYFKHEKFIVVFSVNKCLLICSNFIGSWEKPTANFQKPMSKYDFPYTTERERDF